jgi:imidazole glycerol-phosphate synthase subunit HisF
MLYPRIIPCLLFDENEDMVKTINFQTNSRRYIGDIENAAKIFSEKKADELIILDIDASVKNKEINYDIIKKLVMSCRMPLTYGGGIKNFEQVKKIFSLGVEKIILSSVIYENIDLINQVSKCYGSQSISVCLDLDLSKDDFKLFTKNGTKEHDEKEFYSLVDQIQNRGAGELIINSIDRDGSMIGYNLEKIEIFFDMIKIPLTLLGGAGKIDDFIKVLSKIPISGLAAGSFFIYKGNNNAILINYFDIKNII